MRVYDVEVLDVTIGDAKIDSLLVEAQHAVVGQNLTLEGEKLTRVPRGFDKDHEAAEYLKFRHFIAGAEFPAELAASPKFYSTVLAVFREVLPLSRFLNAALDRR